MRQSPSKLLCSDLYPRSYAARIDRPWILVLALGQGPRESFDLSRIYGILYASQVTLLRALSIVFRKSF